MASPRATMHGGVSCVAICKHDYVLLNNMEIETGLLKRMILKTQESHKDNKTYEIGCQGTTDFIKGIIYL